MGQQCDNQTPLFPSPWSLRDQHLCAFRLGEALLSHPSKEILGPEEGFSKPKSLVNF